MTHQGSWSEDHVSLTEAVGAVFHCGARLEHPGSWSEDHVSINGAVPPSAHVGHLFGQKHAESSGAGIRQCATVCCSWTASSGIQRVHGTDYRVV